jgi:hypothetical protein
VAGWASYNMADEILNFYYRGVPISIGGSLWLRLLVSPSSRSGGGTETNFSGWSRIELPRDFSFFTVAPGNGRLTNADEFETPVANSAGNGDLNFFDIVDTPSGAVNKIYNGGPVVPVGVIAVGKPIKFRAGALIMTF